ncbi:hypothetical protein KR215_009561 [Drosophila sulfurigaster]|nr:hypothetical protein KR215_009561 [Drosophila sulfurigaster]
MDQTQQPQRHIVLHSPRDWTAYETCLNRTLDELNSTFDKMPQPSKPQYSFLCPGPNQLITSAVSSSRSPSLSSPFYKDQQQNTPKMDVASRMHAMKVCNVLLARLWRRRCSEVSDLHELVRKYQLKANSMRDDLFMRNNMINREQERSNRLEKELRRFKQGAIKSHNCEIVDNALNELNLLVAQLRYELNAKTQECKNYSELLLESKTERFREMRKFRECSQELAKQQVQNRILEMRNAELEDMLLNLKDSFQLQNDETAASVFASQEKIDNAYETLKGLEQEAFALEIKNNELMRDTQANMIMQEIEGVQQNIGIVRYLLWLSYRYLTFEIVANLLGSMLHNITSLRGKPMTSLGICLIIVILIGAFY